MTGHEAIMVLRAVSALSPFADERQIRERLAQKGASDSFLAELSEGLSSLLYYRRLQRGAKDPSTFEVTGRGHFLIALYEGQHGPEEAPDAG